MAIEEKARKKVHDATKYAHKKALPIGSTITIGELVFFVIGLLIMWKAKPEQKFLKIPVKYGWSVIAMFVGALLF